MRQVCSRRRFLARMRAAALALAWPATPWAAEPATRPSAARALGYNDRAVLRQLCRGLVPLKRMDQRPIDAVLDALDAQAAADLAKRELLAAGASAAIKSLGKSWRTAPASAVAKHLDSVAGTPFFATLAGTALPMLVNDRRVWALLGYPGESFSRGGYLHRGFNDLKWLPEPPAEAMGSLP